MYLLRSQMFVYIFNLFNLFPLQSTFPCYNSIYLPHFLNLSVGRSTVCFSRIPWTSGKDHFCPIVICCYFVVTPDKSLGLSYSVTFPFSFLQFPFIDSRKTYTRSSRVSLILFVFVVLSS